MCNLCIETTIDKLKSTFVDYSTNDKIVLLSTNVNPRLKEAYYGKELYSYDNMKLDIPYEKKGLPYMFVVDSNMQVKLFFIPDIRTPELTDYYLSCMNKRFF